MNVRRTDTPTLLMHWCLVIALAVSFTTGMRIAADSISPNLAKHLSVLWLQGQVIEWHLYSAWILFFVCLAYPIFLILAKKTRRFSLQGTSTKLRSPARWRAINTIIHIIGFVLILALLITGAFIYWDVLSGKNTALRNIHRWLAWFLVIYVMIHVFAQFKNGGWVQLFKIFLPAKQFYRPAILATFVALATFAAVYSFDPKQSDTLVIRNVQSAPKLDGVDDDVQWQDADEVTIATQRGANFPGFHTQVKIKALRVENTSYWLFQWADSTRSQKHLPLIKTEQGWKVLQNDYGNQDESRYYEDKFSVMLSQSAEIAGAGSVHLGPQPLKNKPGSLSQRGLHYTRDDSIVDVWHWKSVRTSPLKQMDDNFFGPPKPAYQSDTRYIAGYQQDPKTSGGFKANWKFYYDDFVVPKRLPRENYLPRLGNVNLNEFVGDDGIWALSWNHTHPWSEQRDTFPTGTIIPSVLYAESFAGDRGDVSAVGRWHDGQWTLEASRLLNTNSPYDIPIEDGIYLWVAAFDHSQTRHSYHLKPIRLKLP